MAILTAKNWTLSIGEKEYIGPLDFELQAGRILGIVGESGAGKSLLSRALVGQFPQGVNLQGQMLYKDLDIAGFSQKDWQKLRGLEISYMAQNPMALFNPYQTIYSHTYEFLCSHSVRAVSEIKGRMMASMKQCNLENPENILCRYPFELSGGMLQRCMLSMLLCLPNQLFICDEPTSALDITNRNHILKSLENLKKEGHTMVVITHDYQLLTMLADEVLVLKKGKQIEYGPSESVIFNATTDYAKELFLAPNYGRYTDDTH